MDITLDKNSATEASLKIRLSEADYQPNVEKKIKEYSRKANIKGFRPGKAPSTLIKKLYGKGIILEELNQMLNESITNYIKDNNIRIIGNPLPKEKNDAIDLDNQKDFEFEYEIGMISDIEYSLDQKMTRYEIEVDEKSIDETIENIRTQYGETINPESSEEGDYLYGELKQVDGEIQKETVIALFEVDKAERGIFIGRKPEETIEFDIRKTFVEDNLIGLVTGKSPEEAKDISGPFTFKMNKIDRRMPAEMNQEFFDRLFGKDEVKSEEDFREKIRENHKIGYARDSENLLSIQIKEKLLEESRVELPEGFIKKWLKMNEENKEAIDKEFDSYIREMKWSLIRGKIAEDLTVKVEKEDIEAKARSIVHEYLKSSGMPENFIEENMDKFVDNYIKGGQGKTLMELQEQVKNEKIIAAVKDKMDIEQKVVDVEEFKKIVSN